jgi:primosomal protein N' (replication factor Y)
VHALVSGPDVDETAARAEQLAQRARESACEGAVRPSAPAAPFEFAAAFEVLGPAPAPIARLRDRFRFQVLVKGTDEKRVVTAGRAMARAGARREAHGIRVSVDPDPLNML